MKRKFKRTIGDMVYNEQHNFFHGWLKGNKVTMNKIVDKEGKEKWLVSEELDLYESEQKAGQDR